MRSRNEHIRSSSKAADRRVTSRHVPAYCASHFHTLEPRFLLSTYYVDNKPGDHGSNSNAGTSLAAPFLTIQQAASVAQPGDTVNILAGTYRETVAPAHSGTASKPIVYQAYQNQKVVISGADIVSGTWTDYSGSIYKTSAMPWTMGGQDDQVFVDGQMINFARWPNTSLNVSSPTFEFTGPNTTYTESSSGVYTETVYDHNLTQPSGYWNGATIHIESGAAWAMEAAPITSYTLTSINGVSYGKIVYTSTSSNENHGGVVPGDPYYITGDPYFTHGAFQNLDAAGEFFRDPNTGSLYIWTLKGDSPAAHVIEAKHRINALDLRSLSYLTFNGIGIFAAGVDSSSSSSHLNLNGINAQYVSHFENYTGNWSPRLLDGHGAISNTGIILDGSYETLENSTIAYSAGDCVYVGGSNVAIENNVIHDADYSGAGCSAITICPGQTSSGDDIGYNTIYNSARDLINASGITASRIHNNVLSYAMLQSDDGADIYAFGSNANGTEIDHNIISNTQEIVPGWDTAGIFFDDDATGFTADHNVIYNCESGFKANHLQGDNYINNVIYNCHITTIFNNFANRTPSGIFANNILTGVLVTKSIVGFTIENNLQNATSGMFVNTAAGNFQLHAGSPAINAGVVMSPYTNGYGGIAPDEGAYEYGQAAWKAGATAVVVTPPSTTNLPAGYSSKDIGSPAIAGSATYSNGTYTVSGAGSDIWNASDQFQFVSTSVVGNKTITARVSGQTNTNAWAKAGVMFRSTTVANSPFVAVFQTPANEINLEWRDLQGKTHNLQTGSFGGTAYLRITRAGNIFTGFASKDGVTWKTIGSVSLALPATLLAGLAVTSHNTAELGQATFDQVAVG